MSSDGQRAASRAKTSGAPQAPLPSVRPSTRVVEFVRPGCALEATAYLAVGARVTAVADDVAAVHAFEPRLHTVVPWALPTALFGTADVVLAPSDVELQPRLLAPGGVWVRDGGVLHVDPRPAVVLPSALAELGRTSCVDRSRVERAFVRPSWSSPALRMSPDPRVVEAEQRALLQALVDAVAADDLDPDALPWPRHVSPVRDEAQGCDVLVVMPHPDDESIACAATIDALVSEGRRVHLVVATDGAGGRGGTDLARRRALELLHAASLLGVQHAACLGWVDGGKYRDAHRLIPATATDAMRSWGGASALRELVACIRAHRPRTLLTLGPRVDPGYSLHGHHLGLGVLLAVAFQLAAAPWFDAAGAPWAVAEHQVMAPREHGTLGQPVVPARKAAAVRAHASQSYSAASLLELLDRGVPQAEWRRVAQRRAQGRVRTLEVDPRAQDALEQAQARVSAVHAAEHPRAAVLEALQDTNEALGPDPARAASLADMAMEDTVVVVAGQQVGALGGPAFTLTKALAAVALARQLRRRGVRAVPVFWMASYDHDLAEVACAPTLDAGPVRLSCPDGGGPVGPTTLGPDATRWLAAWGDAVGVHDEHPVRRWLSQHHGSDTTFADAFARTLADATRGTGLLMLDPRHASLATAARDVLSRALDDQDGVDAALAASRARVETEVVPTKPGESLVFACDAAGRRRRVSDPGSARAQLITDPESFSPSALLRPVVQDALLPCVATIAGPTEARYLAQTPELYRWADVTPSAVVVRPQVRWVVPEDVSRLGGAAAVQALRATPNPMRTLAERRLRPAMRGWLASLEQVVTALSEALAASRNRTAPQAVAASTLVQDLERTAAAAGIGTLRTATYWDAMAPARSRWCEEAVAGSTRASGRLIRHLRRVGAGVLRDARRHAPSVAAFARLGHDAPAERRMTTAELWVRTSGAAARALLDAFDETLPQSITLSAEEAR
ncbi:MAG: bacillithiol biosynthesis BshC [Myxococcota bacterium]